MATVTIRGYEMRKRLLPPVCLRCGEPACDIVSTETSLYPFWILIFVVIPQIAALLAFFLNRRALVDVPMCRRHMMHFAGLILMRVLALIGFVGGLVTIGVLPSLFADQRGDRTSTRWPSGRFSGDSGCSPGWSHT